MYTIFIRVSRALNNALNTKGYSHCSLAHLLCILVRKNGAHLSSIYQTLSVLENHIFSTQPQALLPGNFLKNHILTIRNQAMIFPKLISNFKSKQMDTGRDTIW